jgi:hypothetical protein
VYQWWLRPCIRVIFIILVGTIFFWIVCMRVSLISDNLSRWFMLLKKKYCIPHVQHTIIVSFGFFSISLHLLKNPSGFLFSQQNLSRLPLVQPPRTVRPSITIPTLSIFSSHVVFSIHSFIFFFKIVKLTS